MCTGNSCRSQIAHGYMELFAGNKADIFSAGIETHGLNPYAVKVMKEDDVDISQYTSNLIDDYLNVNFYLLITVCDHAKETCPVFIKATTVVHKNFSDPSRSSGTEENKWNEFRKIRDEIRIFCQELIQDYLFNGEETPSPL